jgi:hypothetical protein
MMRLINIAIPDDVASRLNELARREYRRPRDQAAVLIIDGLDRVDVPAALKSAEREALLPDRDDRDG